MDHTIFALKGTIAYTPVPDRFVFAEDSFLVCENERVKGIWKELPDELKGIRVCDYTGKIIFPGMCDLHMHAPQYAFRGLGMNLENPDWDMWFEKYAFPDEKRYEDCEYAKKAYERLTDDLLKTTTTRCVMFGTLHRQSTEILMDLLEEKGIAAYVGKVNMDRNSIPGLLETTGESLEETKRWLSDCAEKKQYKKCRPMITPRYIPTCTDELLSGLGELAVEKGIPVQSHLSEGLDEMEWVRELKPEISFYGEGYDRYHMFGDAVPTVMAHCVYSSEEEIALMKKREKLIVAVQYQQLRRDCPCKTLSGGGHPGGAWKRYGRQQYTFSAACDYRCHPCVEGTVGIYGTGKRSSCKEKCPVTGGSILSGHPWGRGPVGQSWKLRRRILL